jgi:sugar-specific transcriptional regulator TrmB
MNLNQILQKIGLTEKESKVYLANLELGTAVVSDISKKAKINRVTTYDILQKLIEKALVSQITKNKMKFFTALDPEDLFNDFQKRVKTLEKSLPEFKRLKGETEHPKVRFFEGIEGIKKIYEDTLSSHTEILNYANSEEIRRFWPEYDEEYVKKRKEKKIFLRGIAPDDQYGRKVAAENKKFHREIRLVQGEQFNFTNEIHIYDNKVAIISINEEIIGTIIESQEIANTQRAIFNMAWAFAEQFTSEFKSRKKQNNDDPSAPLKNQISLF